MQARQPLQDWLDRADAALYRAKAQGRDCVVVDFGLDEAAGPAAAITRSGPLQA